MRRILFHGLAGLSLLLWLAVCVLWVRGFWVSDVFVVGHQGERGDEVVGQVLYLNSDCSQLCIMWRIQRDPSTPELRVLLRARSAYSFGHSAEPTRPFTLLPGDREESIWNRIGFAYQDSDDLVPNPPAGYFDRWWMAPFWFLLMVLAVCPAVVMVGIARRRRIRRRVRLGLCANCGFDLRATPDRCPECGESAAHPS
jgi:hypothetical protein